MKYNDFSEKPSMCVKIQSENKGLAQSQYGSPYKADSNKYQYAMMKVSELLSQDYDIIKKVRAKTMDISSITSEQLKAVCPDLKDELIDILLMPFSQLKV